MSTADADYVAAYLKDADRNRYFATLILPEAVRPAIQALFAFSADVASIRDRAREPAAGEIRLQWWVDALKGEGHGNVRQNPIAAVLLDVIAGYGLPTVPLLRLIAARRFDLYQDPMPDRQSFEGYAGETVSVLYQLAAMVLNSGAEVETGDAAGHLGVADALIGHSRAFGYNASKGRIFLPMEILGANGVTDGEILSGTESEGLHAALAQIADLAREHLTKASVAIAKLPKPLRPAFATMPIIAAELKRLPLSRPFAAPEQVPDWKKLGALFFSGR
jgi:15-cis-phytoene synthase